MRNQNELWHHGVTGQKWGVRNGPPYPLSRAVSTGKSLRKFSGSEKLSREERKKQRAEKARKKAEEDYKKKNSEEYSNKSQAAAFIAKVALDAVALNPVGLADDIYRGGRALAGSAAAKKYSRERARAPKDKKTGFALKQKDLVEKEDLKRVNPSVYNFDSNTKSNCVLCTLTYDMRRRGYDVTAKTAGAGFAANDLKQWYPKAKVNSVVGTAPNNTLAEKAVYRRNVTKSGSDALIKELLKQPNGARGNINVIWANSFSGHSMAYEVHDGKVRILDGQVNKIYEDPWKVLKNTNGAYTYSRLDNVNFNPKTIKRVCS